MTAEDLVQWVMKNRSSGAFREMSEGQIRDRVLKALDNGEVMIDVNNKNEIFGVVFFHRTLHVEHMLTISKYSFKNLVCSLYSRFPGFKAQAERRGRIKNYMTKQLVRKVGGLSAT